MSGRSARHLLLLASLDSNNPVSHVHANGLVWQEISTDVDAWYKCHIDLTMKGFLTAKPGFGLARGSSISCRARHVEAQRRPGLHIEQPGSVNGAMTTSLMSIGVLVISLAFVP